VLCGIARHCSVGAMNTMCKLFTPESVDIG
jgi:hypothetical protein